MAELQNGRGIVHAVQQIDDRAHGGATLFGHLGHHLGLRRHLADIVERHRFGNILDDVQNVVHAADQLMDFVAVKRGDEGRVQLGERVMCNRVGPAFEVVDFFGERLSLIGLVGQGADQVGQGRASLSDQLGVRVEKIEILALPGHQATEHDSSV